MIRPPLWTSCALPVVLWLALAAPAVHAEVLICGKDTACRRAMDHGLELSHSGHDEQALREFLSAYERISDPRLAVNIGKTLHKLSRYNESLDWYHLARKTSQGDLPLLDEIRRHREALEQDQARLRRTTPTVRVINRPTIDLAMAVSAPTTVSNQNVNQVFVNVIPSQSSEHARTAGGSPYRKWWVWTLAGVVVSAGVAGLTAGLMPKPWSPPEDAPVDSVRAALSGGGR